MKKFFLEVLSIIAGSGIGMWMGWGIGVMLGFSVAFIGYLIVPDTSFKNLLDLHVPVISEWGAYIGLVLGVRFFPSFNDD